MGAGEIVAIVVISLIVVGALIYIIKAKKSGKKCIGCPYGCSCNKKNNCCCDSDSCESDTKEEFTQE
ncbi:MAG: hypothetical protein IKC35_02720 [Clostridia bacterium]|nr:hypothetical protein [Clostridia bacterium]